MKKYFNLKEVLKNKDFLYGTNECINCKKCVKICAFLQKYCNDPKEFLNSLDKNPNINYLIPFSCNLCSCCRRVCPKEIDLGQIFFAMRKEISSVNNGKSPITNHKIMHFHQKFSNTNIFKGIYGDKNSTIFFMPGCSLIGYSPDLVIKTYDYLKSKINNLGIILNCCNKPTKDLGEIHLFNKNFNKFLYDIKKYNNGNVEIITACQSCFKVLNEEQDSIKITSLWEILKKVDLPKECINKGKDSSLIFSIKDSCQSLDYNEITDSIRYIITRLGYKLSSEEVTNNCCGLGGLVHLVDKELSSSIKNNSLSQLKSNNIVSYCGGCVNAINCSSKNSYHILDLVFKKENDLINRKKLKISSLKSWKNRYNFKKQIYNKIKKNL